MFLLIGQLLGTVIGSGYLLMPIDDHKSAPTYTQSIESDPRLNELHNNYENNDQNCSNNARLDNSSSNKQVRPESNNQDLSKRYNQIGEELFVSGDREAATSYFQKAKDIEPDNPTILSNYALASGSQSALYDVCNVDSEYGSKTAVIGANYKLHQTIEATKMEGVYNSNPLSILF